MQQLAADSASNERTVAVHQVGARHRFLVQVKRGHRIDAERKAAYGMAAHQTGLSTG